MNFKILFCFILITILNGCSSTNTYNESYKGIDNRFTNKGFTLIYNDDLNKNKQINKKLDNRSLIIFQNRLKKNSTVKIRNIANNKSLIAKVGSNASYPIFFNSVISKRIANELELNADDPYIEISLISNNSMFVAKKVKTFSEEKNVANKAPIDGIQISDLGNTKKKTIKIKKDKFSYSIKIADFYHNKSAIKMVDRIKNEVSIKDAKIKKINETKYRVFLGPFNDISLLKEYFNKISILEFENLEIIKND